MEGVAEARSLPLRKPGAATRPASNSHGAGVSTVCKPVQVRADGPYHVSLRAGGAYRFGSIQTL
jgi:hypothetical protein